MGSPPHSHSSVGRHSRESSSTRFFGSLKPGSHKISPNEVSARGTAAVGGKIGKECDVIEEEGLLEDDDYRKPLPHRCYFLIFVLGFFVLFSFFSLIIWGVARPQKPKITMKSVKFDRFTFNVGSDSTGVATEMASVNCTLKFIYRNTVKNRSSSPVQSSSSSSLLVLQDETSGSHSQAEVEEEPEFSSEEASSSSPFVSSPELSPVMTLRSGHL